MKDNNTKNIVDDFESKPCDLKEENKNCRKIINFAETRIVLSEVKTTKPDVTEEEITLLEEIITIGKSYLNQCKCVIKKNKEILKLMDTVKGLKKS